MGVSENSVFWGAAISLLAYELGLLLKRKFRMAIFNPLLIAIICVIQFERCVKGGKYNQLPSHTRDSFPGCAAVSAAYAFTEKLKGCGGRNPLWGAGKSCEYITFGKTVSAFS